MPTTIALIAHDSQKDSLVEFAKRYAPVLSRYRLIATGTTGQRIQNGAKLQVECLLSGPMGGDAQIAAQVAIGEVLAVIFLVDPLYAQAHEPDIQALLRICNVHNVPLATNLATAEAIATQLAQSRLAYLIFNPVAGQGNPEADLALISELLSPYMHLQVHLTTPEQGAEDLVQEAISARADLVIASGGDGTVSAVAGALIGTSIPLGIIPKGTANAFFNALGLPSGINVLRSACDIILKGNTRVVDAAFCNGKPMILLTGVGYEAETIDKADRELKDRWGMLAYLMAGWRQLDEQQLFETEIEVDGTVHQFQAGSLIIANAAPPTSILAQGLGEVIVDDGVLDITIATATNKLDALNTMLSLLGAALIKTETNQNVTHFRAKQIKVITTPPQKIAIDGEVMGTTPIDVVCVPGGLVVLAPKLAREAA